MPDPTRRGRRHRPDGARAARALRSSELDAAARPRGATAPLSSMIRLPGIRGRARPATEGRCGFPRDLDAAEQARGRGVLVVYRASLTQEARGIHLRRAGIVHRPRFFAGGNRPPSSSDPGDGQLSPPAGPSRIHRRRTALPAAPV